MLGSRVEEAANDAAGGEVLADRAQHDDTNAGILIQGLEHEPQLVTLRHGDGVERRPVENDIGALALRGNLDTETVKVLQSRIRERGTHDQAFRFEAMETGAGSA